jgi:putative FmdB family regulatory protein
MLFRERIQEPMPTYEYHCDACEHQFEDFQSMSEKPLKKCPECGKSKLRRLFGTGAAVLFKGSGFYQTDYRSESYKASAKADQEPAKPGTPDTTATNGKATQSSSSTSDKPAKKSSKADT